MLLGLWLRFSLALITTLAAGTWVVAQETASDLVSRFESSYRHAKTLQATFLERYIENGRQVRSEAGVAYFSKPGKMRWEYESPEHNLFVIDGRWSWFYVPADHTVTRIRAKESADWRTPLALLAGEVKVSHICAHVNLEQKQATHPGGAVLKCSLRAKQAQGDRKSADLLPSEASPTADTILFEIDAQNGELLRIEATDPGGVQIEFRFANWRFNPDLERSMFQFAPPKGVAIVDGELAAGKKPLTSE